MGRATVVIVIAVVTICCKNAQGSVMFNRMMGHMFAKIADCTVDLQEKLSPEVCLTQFDGDEDPNSPKFEPCKRTMTCALKKMDFMTKDGMWDDKKILALAEAQLDEETKAEFKTVYNTCKSVVTGTNSEAVVNMMTCVLKNSPKAREGYKELKDILKRDDD